MAKRKGLHKSDKEQYNAYEAKGSKEANRKAKLARHAKKHPNDKQAEKASLKVKDYKNKPNTKGNYPAKKDNLMRDAVTGQPIADAEFTNWNGNYDPIPVKRKRKKNEKAS